MRRLVLWIWVLFTGSVLVLLFFSSHDNNVKTDADLKNLDDDNLELTERGTREMIITSRRITKETNSITTRPKTKMDSGNFNVEDYPPFDPTPASRADIRNGPIEHGTPLRPYIPRLTPPAFGPGHGSGSAPGPLNPPSPLHM